MKKIVISFIVAIVFCSGISRADTCGNEPALTKMAETEILIAANEADQKQDAEKRAAEDRMRQEKIEADKRANEDRERQQKAEAEKIRKEKIEADRREQDLRKQQQLQESEKKAYEDRIRQEKIEADRKDQELKRQQTMQEAEKKAYEDRIRQEKIENARKEQELKLRNDQMEAEKKSQEATLEKEREEAKKHAEELKKQQQSLEAERRSEEIRRREEEQRAQRREDEHRKDKERLEAQKRAEEHRRWHKKHGGHHHHDNRYHYHLNNKYNDETTIIFTEQYHYYPEPYPYTSYPVPVYDQPYSGTTAPQKGNQAPEETVFTEEDAVKNILESEAFIPDNQISEASPDFCKSFLKSLKANNGEIIFEKPVVSTDDPESADLARNFPCYKKAGDEESVAKSLSMAGEQNFKLYRLKKDLSSKNSDYEYMLYSEPSASTGRSDLIPGFYRIDKNTCKIRQEVTVNENNPDTGNFSSIVRYKKQYYILSVAVKGNETEQIQKHIIKLHQYSSKKGIFEQSPYAYWSEPTPIN